MKSESAKLQYQKLQISINESLSPRRRHQPADPVFISPERVGSLSSLLQLSTSPSHSTKNLLSNNNNSMKINNANSTKLKSPIIYDRKLIGSNDSSPNLENTSPSKKESNSPLYESKKLRNLSTSKINDILPSNSDLISTVTATSASASVVSYSRPSTSSIWRIEYESELKRNIDNFNISQNNNDSNNKNSSGYNVNDSILLERRPSTTSGRKPSSGIGLGFRGVVVGDGHKSISELGSESADYSSSHGSSYDSGHEEEELIILSSPIKT